MNNLMRRGYQLETWRKCLKKSYATMLANEKRQHSYEDMISRRQSEAARSVVVQVNSEKSFPELSNYCRNFGNIIDAYHYTVQHDDEHHYILLEFSNTDEAAAAIDSSSYNKELTGVPVRSPFLWFRASERASKSIAQPNNTSVTNLNIINGTFMLSNAEINNVLHAAENINDQINLLHQHTQLNELGVRLRFLAALQVQQAVTGMFPNANAQPFGSSVNGFGRMGCDLDLILRFDREITGLEKQGKNESRLVFHTKENLTNGRSQTQRQMESIGDMLHLFLPGVCHVRRILQARVPIIKYHHEHLNLEVDLSMSNLSGFYMSELLFMFGEYDDRVRPLTFCIRRWANSCGLTNPVPGRWITNFSLTCLVIYFLQQMKHPILPSINSLMKAATRDDFRSTEDGINCTFTRNLDLIKLEKLNKSNVSQLLLQFFEFYSQFDFHNRAISLNEGRSISKPDHSPMYIVNPLEQNLNVSKNVSMEECERLRVEVRNAAWVLDSEVENLALPENEKLETRWGLLNLFKTNEKSIIRPNMFFKPRMVDVTDLFDKSDSVRPTTATATTTTVTATATEASIAPTTTTTTTTTTRTATYKSTSVKQQVQQIKAQARSDLKQIRLNTTQTNADATTSRRRTR